MMENVLHLKAPENWINDPNGFIYYRGKYHLFYQYFPYAPVWGTMHWGHAVSDDLVHWRHLGVALFPTKKYDRNGVFSGSALEKDGEMYLYFSAVRYLKAEEENIHKSVGEQFETSQAMIVSRDGFHFDNWKGKRQILQVIRDEEVGDAANTRDPKVWYDDGTYYMVLGSTYQKKRGRALFYKSKDAVNWEYAAQCVHGGFGRILECPDLFRVGGSYVFVGSPMYLGPGEMEGLGAGKESLVEAGADGCAGDGRDVAKGYEHHAVCALAEFDKESCTLTLTGKMRCVDYGLDLYAPQTNLDETGRRVLVAWVRMPRAVESEGETAWNGMMCLPRLVEVGDGHVFFRVHPRVDAYFSERVASPSGQEIFVSQEDLDCKVDYARPYRIKTSLGEGERLDVGGYRIWLEEGCLKTDRGAVFSGIEGIHTVCGTPRLARGRDTEGCRRPDVGACGCDQGEGRRPDIEPYGRVHLDIFVEPNLIETFVNDGEYVVSNIVYGLKERIMGRVEGIWQESL